MAAPAKKQAPKAEPKTNTALAVAPVQNTALAVLPPAQGGEDIDSSDVILPAVYLMQKMSEWVGDELAKAGQFVKSINKAVIGGRGTAVELVPLSFNKSFRIAEAVGNKWVRNEPWDPAKSQEWEFEEEGKSLKRVKCINVYALLMPEVVAEAKEKELVAKSGEMFDLEKALTPVLISFRSSSFKAGKVLTDHFAKAQQYKAEPYVLKFKLDSHEDSNDDGDFYVSDVVSAGKLPQEFYETCAYWRGLILKGKTKVVETEEAATETEGSEPSQY